MKKIFSMLLCAMIILGAFVQVTEARSYRTKSSDVHVKGYYKKNGTYVSPHYRSAPDGIISNNYSCIDDGRCGTSSSSSTYEAPKYSTPSHTPSIYSSPSTVTTPSVTVPKAYKKGVGTANERTILQDVNLRLSPGISSRILFPVIKGQSVKIIDIKSVGGKIWYKVNCNGSIGWISAIGFVYDPTKASAADCDPINGHVDEKGYCSCNDGYGWSSDIGKCTYNN